VVEPVAVSSAVCVAVCHELPCCSNAYAAPVPPLRGCCGAPATIVVPEMATEVPSSSPKPMFVGPGSLAVSVAVGVDVVGQPDGSA
jgi:hypothetical protein